MTVADAGGVLVEFTRYTGPAVTPLGTLDGAFDGKFVGASIASKDMVAHRLISTILRTGIIFKTSSESRQKGLGQSLGAPLLEGTERILKGPRW